MTMTEANLDAVEKEPQKWRSPLTPTSKNKRVTLRLLFIFLRKRARTVRGADEKVSEWTFFQRKPNATS